MRGITVRLERSWSHVSDVASESLCVDEIEHLETEQVLDPVQMETKEISTAFSWLFNHGDNDYEMQLDRPAESPGGMPRQYLSSLSERGEVAQDSVSQLFETISRSYSTWTYKNTRCHISGRCSRSWLGRIVFTAIGSPR